MLFVGFFCNVVSLIEANPYPWVLKFLYVSLERYLANWDLLY